MKITFLCYSIRSLSTGEEDIIHDKNPGTAVDLDTILICAEIVGL